MADNSTFYPALEKDLGKEWHVCFIIGSYDVYQTTFNNW